ncbi:MAG: aldo/keto reductase [Ignavibacteria bacterium]|jgi:aryl-alcohol dehydrogenase-like predicted oxidoreductase|nr:aldo/keto reductase [Ignavibacteria bacterium]MDH7527904.1 aldo/keto reductase [Ignavibacteria bacterium]
MKFSRRNFIKVTIAAAGTYFLTKSGKLIPELAAKDTKMPKRVLGKTGYQVGIFSLGGQATLEQAGTEKESIKIINRAIDLGVNYIDTAAAYGQGISETYIGKVMKDRRNEVFLATKTHNRSYDGSMQLLEKSLKQLQTDRIDLWQLHNVRTEDDLKKIFASDGAIKALEEARRSGVVRYLGITGHYDPWVLKKGIDEYDFDCILMALNAADRHNKSFIDNLLPFAVQKNLGIIGMKIPARGRIFREGGITSMKQAMEYVLTLPVSTIIVGISTLNELEENIRIAKNFKPLSEKQMRELEELTKPYFDEAAWFKSKW